MPRRAASPSSVDEAGADEVVDVRCERERNEVGLEPRLDRAGLLSRGAVGLREVDVLPGRVFWNIGMSFA